MMEFKVLRRVRTEAGVRRFKQPLGSIIVADGKLDKLKLLEPKFDGFDLVQGPGRKKYDVGKVDGKYAATAHGDWKPIVTGSSLEDVYKKLNAKLGGDAKPATTQPAARRQPVARMPAASRPRPRIPPRNLRALPRGGPGYGGGNPDPSTQPVDRVKTVSKLTSIKELTDLETPSQMQIKLKDLNPALAKEIADLYQGQFGKFKTEIRMDASYVQGKRMFIYGRIKSGPGRARSGPGQPAGEVGYFARIVDLEKQEVLNTELALDDKYTGQKFADSFYPETAKKLKAVGIKKMRLTANDDVGGYAWAVRGVTFDAFHWQPASRSISRRILGFLKYNHEVKLAPEDRQQLEEWKKRIERARKPGRGVPTAMEIASFGKDKYQYKSTTRGGREFTNWPGKAIMLGATWEGEQDIDDIIAFQKKNLEDAVDYMDRVRALYDEEEANYQPDSYEPHGKKKSDYNLFHVDLFLPPAKPSKEVKMTDEQKLAELVGLFVKGGDSCKYCKAPGTELVAIGNHKVHTCKGHAGMAKRAANRKAGVKGWAMDLAYSFEVKRVRHVRTAAGARKYGQPIGSIIELDAVEVTPDNTRRSGGGRVVGGAGGGTSRSVASRRTSRSTASSRVPAQRGGGSGEFAGMRKATDADKKQFRETTGKAIPPAWSDVFVANDLRTATLLARGNDTKGRVQRIYSEKFTAQQAAVKFARLKQLERHITKLDAALERDAMEDPTAAAVLLIRRMGMRPGSDKDTGAEKEAHGATNLKASHVTVGSGGKVKFDFTGKKGVHIQLEVDDPEIADVIRAHKKGKRGNTRLFETDEVKARAYMREAGVPAGFLLKDLRTRHANIVALRTINEFNEQFEPPATKTEFRKWRKEVAEVVSGELGNTPTLALSSYINPVVFDGWVQDESWR